MNVRHPMTDKQRAEEADTARRVGAWFGWELRRFPSVHAIDYYAHDNGAVEAWIEIKCKARPFGNVGLDWSKYLWLLHAWAASGVRSLFVVRFTDAIAWVDVATIPVGRLHVAGRKDRGDPADLMPMFWIDAGDLTRLGEP